MTKSNSNGIIEELEKSVFLALQNYSNVHRGSGHNSMVSTHLFERARKIVLDYLELDKKSYTLVFCSPRRADILTKKIKKEEYKLISSQEIGLSIGVKAVAIRTRALPKGSPFQTGGGTTSLISKDWIVWAKSPDKFEAGTPAIINIIMFAKALLLVNKYGKDIFLKQLRDHNTNGTVIQDDLQSFQGQDLLDRLKQTLIGGDTLVPTMEGQKKYINLDNSASTPTFEPIWNSFRQNYIQTPETQAKTAQYVREVCANHFGSPLSNYDIVFTSNTTESINLCSESFSRSSGNRDEAFVLSTNMEHSSNDLPWRMIPGSSVISLDVDDEGFIDLSELESLFKSYNQDNKQDEKAIKLMVLSGASNVFGSCNDVAAVSQIAHKYGVRLLVDGAQLIAHRNVDMEALGIDYLAFSAHKVYAPFGCGVLIARKGLLNFENAEFKQINTYGEENASGIAALGKSLEIIQRIGMELIEKEEQILTRMILNKLSHIKGLKVYGVQDIQSARFDQKLGVIVFDFKGMMADKVATALAYQSGIGVRNGCMCSHIIIKRILNVSPFLEKFQRLIVSIVPGIKLPGLTRISFGLQNSINDLDTLVDSLNNLTKYQRVTSAAKSQTKERINDFVKDLSASVY